MSLLLVLCIAIGVWGCKQHLPMRGVLSACVQTMSYLTLPIWHCEIISLRIFCAKCYMLLTRIAIQPLPSLWGFATNHTLTAKWSICVVMSNIYSLAQARRTLPLHLQCTCVWFFESKILRCKFNTSHGVENNVSHDQPIRLYISSTTKQRVTLLFALIFTM